ncbi:MAG: hypothetical protein KatS3mg008_2147 [Acidimicrobiales bacterium]|nr:MAG: hypothetical protein KatS3mg008_2147 [Acidimicrobiales bacterium]
MDQITTLPAEAETGEFADDNEYADDNWMRVLARKYRTLRRAHPDTDLALVFDIDGTILDMRHALSWTLLEFDRVHGTRFFKGLTPSDVTVHEDEVERIFERFPVPPHLRLRVVEFYRKHLWSKRAMLHAHKPYEGVLDVIRWFDLQPNTIVVLNTGRPEHLRADTLESLNRLGEEYRIRFDPDLLFMNPHGWNRRVSERKAEVLEIVSRRAIVVAVVDNEVENLEEMAKVPLRPRPVFMHADTIWKSRRRGTAPIVSGDSYALSELVSPEELPRHVELVWHGINDRANLDAFLGSWIRWGECDVRTSPTGELVCRHDSFEENPWHSSEELLDFSEVAERILGTPGKALKVDVKEGGDTLTRVVESLRRACPDGSRLWVNGSIGDLGAGGISWVRSRLPNAIVQCPIDFALPLLDGCPNLARDLFEELRSWGVNRLSVHWDAPRVRSVVRRLAEWQFECNIYGVGDLESFLRAVVLLPTSVTADFDFPKWGLGGRGSGAGRRVREAVPA